MGEVQVGQDGLTPLPPAMPRKIESHRALRRGQATLPTCDFFQLDALRAEQVFLVIT